MSGNTLAGANKSKTITVRVDGATKEKYRDQVDSMSGDLEAYIRSRVADTREPEDTPLIPPREPRLERGYKRLCAAATQHGHVPDETARRVTSGGRENIGKSETKDLVLAPLNRRGYIRPIGSVFARKSAWKLNGWDDE
jgi:hypothetical protein